MRKVHIGFDSFFFLLIVVTVPLFAASKPKDEPEPDPLTRDISIVSSLETTETDLLSMDGGLSLSAEWEKTFRLAFEIGIKNGDTLVLSRSTLGWQHGFAYVDAGYAKQRVGAGLFRAGTARLGSSRGIADEIADEYGYIRKGPLATLGLGYKKDIFPYSSNLTVRYLDETTPPAASISTAIHLGKRDRIIGFAAALLPLRITDAVEGRRIDLHALGTLYAADFESSLVWSLEMVGGTLPDQTPWSFPEHDSIPFQVFGGAEITAGFRLEAATNTLLPGFMISSRIPDLTHLADFDLRLLAGIKAIPFKGASAWIWGGFKHKANDGMIEPAWNVGLELEL